MRISHISIVGYRFLRTTRSMTWSQAADVLEGFAEYDRMEYGVACAQRVKRHCLNESVNHLRYGPLSPRVSFFGVSGLVSLHFHQASTIMSRLG